MEQTNPQKTGPKDILSQLLSSLLLYVSVFSFGALAFQLINIQFPDSLEWTNPREAMRFPLAVLTIVFPVYVWLTSWIQKDIAKNPEKKEMRTRRWLLYITLFATTIVILIDLITLMYRFLQGDLATPFLLKVLTVLILGVLVFVYYLWNLRNAKPALEDEQMKWFVYGVIALALSVIVYGFVSAGSPMAERLKRFDEIRVSNLSEIQWQIINYWQGKEKLPESIDDLRNDIGQIVPPVDPETKEPYEYKNLGNLKFELCATFKTSNKEGANPKPVSYPMDPSAEIWQHEAERTCFTRTIDPDLYPPIRKDRPTVPAL